MAGIATLDLLDLGDDVLLVRGTDGRTEYVCVGTEDDGTPIVDERPVVFEATGWVSAITNHFDASDYFPDGNRKPLPPPDGVSSGERNEFAMPRKMTAKERTAYAVGLLRTQNPALRLSAPSLLEVESAADDGSPNVT